MNEPFAFIVEDNDDLSNIFDHALQAAGFATQVFQCGDTAYEALSTVSPDVVVLDLHLPYVEGVEIFKKIRTTSHLKYTRVIIVSADDCLADTLRDEADLVLIKPIDFEQLRALSARLRDAGRKNA